MVKRPLIHHCGKRRNYLCFTLHIDYGGGQAIVTRPSYLLVAACRAARTVFHDAKISQYVA